jgi:uncharacterized protein YbjT (DUF2867 family)
MYTVMGITGQVGGATARALLAAGKQVRAIVRDKGRAAAWAARGVDLVAGDYDNGPALEAAFHDVEGAFVMIPGNFAPEPGFPQARAQVASLKRALDAARPPKAVYLSSVGAQHPRGLGLITQLHILEQELAPLPIPGAFLRAAWFLENSQWDVTSARDRGEIASFLFPLDRKFPMVATEDIGKLAAKILQQEWTGVRYPEIEGPQRYSALDAAAAFAVVLGREVHPLAVPRESWATLFVQQGTPPERTAARIEMLDGLNSGWIDFDPHAPEHAHGERTQEEVFRSLAGKA